MNTRNEILILNTSMIVFLIGSVWMFTNFMELDDTPFDVMSGVSPIWAVCIALYLPTRQKIDMRLQASEDRETFRQRNLNMLVTALINFYDEIKSTHNFVHTMTYDKAFTKDEESRLQEAKGAVRFTRDVPTILPILGTQAANLPAFLVNIMMKNEAYLQTQIDVLRSQVTDETTTASNLEVRLATIRPAIAGYLAELLEIENPKIIVDHHFEDEVREKAEEFTLQVP